MKPLIIFALMAAIGCNAHKHQRYFYIGYIAGAHTGCFTSKTGSFPSYIYLEDLIFNQFKCEGYTKGQILITSIFEFKDSVDFNKWANPVGKDFGVCEPGTIQHIILPQDTYRNSVSGLGDTINFKNKSQ